MPKPEQTQAERRAIALKHFAERGPMWQHEIRAWLWGRPDVGEVMADIVWMLCRDLKARGLLKETKRLWYLPEHEERALERLYAEFPCVSMRDKQGYTPQESK